jgi:hypothetical protein
MSNILEEVKKLLGKGAIELVPLGQEGQGFYSTFFIVPKKDGGNELPVHKTSDTSCEVETWEFVGMHLADLR